MSTVWSRDWKLSRHLFSPKEPVPTHHRLAILERPMITNFVEVQFYIPPTPSSDNNINKTEYQKGRCLVNVSRIECIQEITRYKYYVRSPNTGSWKSEESLPCCLISFGSEDSVICVIGNLNTVKALLKI